QGVLPYGAQVLLLGSVFNLSPLEVVANSYYCFALAIAAVVAVFIKHPARQPVAQTENYRQIPKRLRWSLFTFLSSFFLFFFSAS
ncbi:hypothetical protein OFN56_37665, partial [Escherichia coli]|nr:hypothetical protein [Escherichia coli]